MESVVYQSPDVFSFHYFFQVAVHVHVENVDGQMVFLAHRSCGEVHYFQAFVIDFIVCDFTELRGRGVFFRVGRVHAVHTRPFKHHVGFDFNAAQRGTRVGREIRVARTGAHDNHFSGFHALDGFPFVVKLADRLHADGGQHAAFYADGSQGTAQSERIDDRGAHAHLVAFDTVESLSCTAQAAEYVAAADDDADLHAHVVHFFDLFRIFGQTLFVDAVTLFSHEALAAQFEEYSFEFSHNKVFWWVKVRMGRTGLCPTVSGGLLP